MSKTLYVNGVTGVAAIFEGDNLSILDDPYGNVSDIFFHSDFNYIKYHTEFNQSFSFPAIPASSDPEDWYQQTETTLGTVNIISGYAPLVLITLSDGYPLNGHTVVQLNSYKSWRVLREIHELSGTALTIKIENLGFGLWTSGLAAYSATANVKVFYVPINNGSNDVIYIDQSLCTFGRKFSSANKYAYKGSSGFALPTGPTINLAGGALNFTTPSSIMVSK